MTADKKPEPAKFKDAERSKVRPTRMVKGKPKVIYGDDRLAAEADAMGARAMRTKPERPA